MRILLLLSILGLSIQSLAQQYNYINYAVEDGLVQNQVYAMIQDDYGYLWFGTTGGVSRFDGEKFTNYSQRDGLLRNQVNAFYKDWEGNLWIATIGGVTKYDGREFTTVPFRDDLSAVKITAIAQDVDGNMWFGTDGGGLVYLIEGRLGYFSELDGLKDDKVRTLWTDHRHGVTWVGTREGINWIKEGGIYDFAQPEIDGSSVSHITGNSQGEVWVSTFGDGVFLLDTTKVVQLTDADGLIVDWVKQALNDNDGHTWYASRYGVTEFNGSEYIERYTLSNGLPFEDIKCLLQDREGNIWMGTNGQGVLKFSGKGFLNYTLSDGLPDEQIMSVGQDAQGRIWLGSFSSGIILKDSSGYSNFSKANDLDATTVWSVLKAIDGSMYFGTTEGLICVKNNQIKRFEGSEIGLNDRKITCVYQDLDGLIWVGNRKGICHLADTTFTCFSDSNGFAGSNVRSIIEAEPGKLWCGTENGVIIFDKIRQSSRRINLGTELNDTKVFSIIKDTKGTIWIGTDNGLFRATSGDRFGYVQLGADARTDFINFIIPDEDGIWAGTNFGIYHVDSDDPGSAVRSFTNHEGLKNLECNMNAAFKDNNGYYWFGTAGGLVRMDRSRIQSQEGGHHELRIRNLKLFMEETDWSAFGKIDEKSLLPKNLVLPHTKNHLTFDFIMFNFSNPKNVLYRFKIIGFDESWSPASHNSSATYSYLPPGEYTFAVQARTTGGEWTESTLFPFEIKPPFWNTWWFYSICFIALLLLGLAFWMWRRTVSARKRATQELVYKNKLLALEHQSLNASMNRHFIFNALNSIQYYINRQDRISANKYLSSFAKLIRKNLDSSSSGNNYVTLAEEIERIDLYLSLEHMRFRNKFEYEIKYLDEIETEAIMVPAMLLQPFIENSIWHGILPMEHMGKIELIISKTKRGDIRFEIIDNGIGIDQSKEKKARSGVVSHESKGMQITSGRIELLKALTRKNISLKGPLEIKDNQGNVFGTKVEIIIPTNTMETISPKNT